MTEQAFVIIDRLNPCFRLVLPEYSYQYTDCMYVSVAVSACKFVAVVSLWGRLWGRLVVLIGAPDVGIFSELEGVLEFG